MKTQNPETQHFDTRLNRKSYWTVFLIGMIFLVLILNIINIEKNKKTEAPTSVTHNVNI